jgi:alcohol-forming fatty acyl-CoA reductase
MSFESEIAKFYSNKCVFITGATGFIGKVLIEKLLRSCPNVKLVYVLVRAKKGKSPRERLDELFGCELFDKLRQLSLNNFDKIIAINGDVMEPNLGISLEDEETLIKNVNIIIHSAATVRFDEPLKIAFQMNVDGVRKIISLAKKIKNLNVFVHVSTAFANCDRTSIEEVTYKPKLKVDFLQESLEWLDDDLVNKLTPKILDGKPNTYTFTKAIAESIIMEHKNDLPLVIVRPSIVAASAEEPFPGWIDNINGVTGIILASGKGVLRTMFCKADNIADLIPVDFTSNLIISSAWYRGSNQTEDCLIYNFTSGKLNPLTWTLFENYGAMAYYKYPFENPVLFPRPVITESRIVAFFKQLFEQKMVAYLFDFILILTRKKPFLVKINKKIEKHIGVMAFFSTKQWNFSNENVLMLSNKLNSIDSKVFNFDVMTINWQTFIKHYCLGAKKFLLKEDMKNIIKARNDLKRMKRLTITMKTLFFLLILRFYIFKSSTIRKLVALIFKILISIGSHFRSCLV